MLLDLHYWVHAAVDSGNTPGWTSGDQSISCRRKNSLLILIEGLERRILAWTLQLVSERGQDRKKEELIRSLFIDISKHRLGLLKPFQ